LINAFNTKESVEIINKVIHDSKTLSKYVRNARDKIKKFTWEDQSNRLNSFLLNIEPKNYVDVLELKKGNYDELKKIDNTL
jgi:hypothetical protein